MRPATTSSSQGTQRSFRWDKTFRGCLYFVTRICKHVYKVDIIWIDVGALGGSGSGSGGRLFRKGLERAMSRIS